MPFIKVAITGHKMYNVTHGSYEADLTKADCVFYVYCQNRDEAYRIFNMVKPNLRSNRTHAFIVQNAEPIDFIPDESLLAQCLKFSALVFSTLKVTPHLRAVS